MTTTSVPLHAAPGDVAGPGSAPRHSRVDDVTGIVTGTVVASLGLFLLRSGSAVTGGTAGIGLLVSYASGWDFGVVFLLVNLPFLALAWWKKGRTFAVRTLVSVALVSVFASLHAAAFEMVHVNPAYGVVVGNLLAGVGMLIVFRHRSSLGGLNVVALIAQERLGWRAGYVQMAFDVTIILSALAVVPAGTVLLSALGAVVLNVVLALNHRPGRYLVG